MKKTKTKLVSGILTLSMLVSGFSCFYTPVYAASMTAGGWYETIYADITGVKDADVTAVSYTGEMSGTLTGEDFEYLVRDGENGVRIDIPGLKAGDYTLKVTVGGTEYTQNVTVMEYDRSGYAHFNYSGVGAYNDDGTLKTGAKVLYVTNENKDTVSVTSSDGTTVAGIGNILNSRGGRINKNDKGVVLSDVINTNQDIIRKLSQDGTPLVVRFIGDVKAPEGLTAYDSYDYGGTEGDNGFMARMLSGNNVTLEGIGYDAKIDGWGVHYICESAYPEYGKSFEVRNLDFYGSPEDSIGMEGQQKSNAITAGVERCWIHNNTFEPQVQAQYAESDKKEGDGCCDFKRGMYMTMSYNKFINAHKTCLVGSSDSSLQFNITWHHNYFYHNESRAPLGRQANMHIYNNYFYNQTDKTMDARANCYIFSEYNQLEYCKNPMIIRGGAVIKSLKDNLITCIEGEDSEVVTSRETKVNSSNQYADFENNSALSYIPDGNYKLQTDAADAKAECLAYSGVMKKTVVKPEDEQKEIVTEAETPAAAVSLPFTASYVSGGTNAPTAKGKSTVANVKYNVYKINADSISLGSETGGKFVIFKLDKKAKITMSCVSATAVPALYDECGKDYIVGSGTAVVPAGIYFIEPNAVNIKDMKYKEAKLASLTITEAADEEVSGSARESVEKDEPVSIKGDVNVDGVLDAADAKELLRFVSGLSVIADFDESAADYNGDGSVDLKDVIALSAKAGLNGGSGGSGGGEEPSGDRIYPSEALASGKYGTFKDANIYASDGYTSDKRIDISKNGYVSFKLDSQKTVAVGTKTAGINVYSSDGTNVYSNKKTGQHTFTLPAGYYYITNYYETEKTSALYIDSSLEFSVS